MFNRKTWGAVFCGLILMAAAAGSLGARTDEASCAQVKAGAGYFLYFLPSTKLMASLDEKAQGQMRTLLDNSAQKVMQTSFTNSANLHQPPFSLTEGAVVKVKMEGALIDRDKKKLTEAAAGKDLGVVVMIVAGAFATGPQEGKSLLKTEELPIIDIKNGNETYKMFNFVDLDAEVYSVPAGKTIAKPKEKVYSYREWFMKKYPGFFNGESDALPEGVDYNSAAQYQQFLKESIDDLLNSAPEYKTLAGCKPPTSAPAPAPEAKP